MKRSQSGNFSDFIVVLVANCFAGARDAVGVHEPQPLCLERSNAKALSTLQPRAISNAGGWSAITAIGLSAVRLSLMYSFGPWHRIIARSITFRSWRISPGQWWS